MKDKHKFYEGQVQPLGIDWGMVQTSAPMKSLLNILAVAALLIPMAASAQDNSTNLAQELTNPIANLVSLPFQFNYDGGIGLADGKRAFVNIQPVVPFSLNEKWNLISRTILPVTYQDEVVPDTDQFGLGDVVQSLFFSPKEPTKGVIWGAGPVALLPTATDEALGTGKFGIGPTGVALVMKGPWTFSFLTNHIWSFAGDNGRRDVNQTLLQPAISYTTENATSFIVNNETTYDWVDGEASIPLNAGVRQVFTLGERTIAIGGFARYWVNTPDSGPEGFGARLEVTFLFPT